MLRSRFICCIKTPNDMVISTNVEKTKTRDYMILGEAFALVHYQQHNVELPL